VVAWAGAEPQPLVPGIAYGDAGDDVLGAAVAADGALTVHLARFDATGQAVATLDLPERSAATSLATVEDDGTTLVVGSDAKSAYRWSPGATTLRAIALPYAPGRPADDDALLPHGRGGAWLRAARHVLHVGPTDALAVKDPRPSTTVVVGAGGDALFGHGASIAVVDPSGAVVSDARTTGVVKGAGIVSVLAVASGSGRQAGRGPARPGPRDDHRQGQELHHRRPARCPGRRRRLGGLAGRPRVLRPELRRAERRRPERPGRPRPAHRQAGGAQGPAQRAGDRADLALGARDQGPAWSAVVTSSCPVHVSAPFL
jgi:hypothetical protein